MKKIWSIVETHAFYCVFFLEIASLVSIPILMILSHDSLDSQGSVDLEHRYIWKDLPLITYVTLGNFIFIMEIKTTYT